MMREQMVGKTTEFVPSTPRLVSDVADNPLIRKVLTCNKSILKRNFLFLLSVLIYRVCLDVIYIQCIAPIWGYYQLTYEPEAWLMILSWIILAFFSVFVIPFLTKSDNIVSIIAILFFFVRIVPFTSFIACKAQSVDFVFWQVFYWFFVFAFLRYWKPIHVPKMQKNGVLLNWIVFALIGTVIFISGYYTHFRLNFSLLNVYDLRFEARGYDVPSLLAYLWDPAGNILPIVLIYFIQKKKLKLTYFVAFIIFLNFSINGVKSVIFKLFLCLFLYFFMKQRLLDKVSWLFLVLVGVALLEWKVVDTTVVSSMLIQRFLYFPLQLDVSYYNYALYNEPIFFADRSEVSLAIGDEYTSGEPMLANNGMFSDAYVNLGMMGCFIFPFLYALFLKMCESAFRGVNEQIVFFAAILIVVTLHGMYFTTALFSGGIFLLALVVYLLPNTTPTTPEILNRKSGIL